MSEHIPSMPPEVYARTDHTEALLGQRGVQVRLTFESGGSIERKYVLLDGDDGTGYLTRAYAIGDLLAMHASGFSDYLLVLDNADHEIDMVDFDPIVAVHIENVRIHE